MNLDGSNYISVTVPTSELIGDSPDRVSISAWIKLNAMVNERIFTKNGPIFFYIENSKLRGGVYNGTWKYTPASGPDLTNEWHHVGLVYDGSEIRLYVDSQVYENPTIHNGDIPVGSNGAGFIGKYSNKKSNPDRVGSVSCPQGRPQATHKEHKGKNYFLFLSLENYYKQTRDSFSLWSFRVTYWHTLSSEWTRRIVFCYGSA